MKRSEMLENIATELIRKELNFPDFATCTFIAEKILARIEREGMLPCSFYQFSSGTYCTAKNINEELETWGERGRFEWEPEDD